MEARRLAKSGSPTIRDRAAMMRARLSSGSASERSSTNSMSSFMGKLLQNVFTLWSVTLPLDGSVNGGQRVSVLASPLSQGHALCDESGADAVSFFCLRV